MSGNDPNDGVNRRSVLKNSAAIGTALFGVGSASLPAAASDDAKNPENLKVLDTRDASSEVAAQDHESLQSVEEIQQLTSKIQEAETLDHATQHSLELTTNDPEVNESNPRLVFSAYTPAENSAESSGRRRRSGTRDTSQERIAAGLVISLTAEVAADGEEPTRQPVHGFAITTKAPEGGAQTSGGPDSLVRDLYAVNKNERVEKVHSELIDAPSSGDISAEGWQSALCNGSCIAVVGAVCDMATGNVTRYICLKACAPFLGSVWGYGACGGACFVIVDAINNRGCYVGAGAICAEIC